MIEVYWHHEDQSHHVKFPDDEMAEADFLAGELYSVVGGVPVMTYPMQFKVLNPDKIIHVSYGC